MSKQRNSTLDLLKGFACIAVVLIHVQFPGTFGQLIVAYGRTGVALFFVIAGYYAYYKSSNITIGKLKKRLKRNGKVTCIAFGVYIFWGIFVRYIGAGKIGVLAWIHSFGFNDVCKMLFLNEDIIIGHLWFLLTLLYCYIFMITIVKFRLLKVAYRFMLPTLFVGIFVMEYSHMVGLTISIIWFRNVWFYGMPFFLIGHWIHSKEEKILKNVEKKKCKWIIAVSCLIVTIERSIFGNLQLFIGTVFLTISCFVFSLYQIRIPKWMEIIKKLGAEYSLNIYIYHWIVKDIFIKLGKIFQCSDNIIFRWFQPICVLGITILGAICMRIVQEKRNFFISKI